MSITLDSNAPYATAFTTQLAGNAVYMTAEDQMLGRVLAIVYRAKASSRKLSVILIGDHGTSGYVDMTLDATSRYFGACDALSPAHADSSVRRALAIAALRTYATMDRPLRNSLMADRGPEVCDESAAGALGSRFHLLFGKYPKDIGSRTLKAGLLSPKIVKTSVVDIVYEDNDATIDLNNELVYILGRQLEQLFDPLSEYSPEPAELLYAPPEEDLHTLEDEEKLVQDICEELFLLQAHIRQELMDFLKAFLIPLRVKVLNGELPNYNIEKLNVIFPPTIDELFRINTIFYEALKLALPYGSFEVLKACGITLPYFYRACMRHEAATKDFDERIAKMSPEDPIKKSVEAYSPKRIQFVIRSCLNLPKLKLIMDRLMNTKKWPPTEKAVVTEYYQAAIEAINAFGVEENMGSYNKRVFTATGKLLVELAENWPSELEYGWMNRRVVAIFDAFDVLEDEDRRRLFPHIIILFTDTVVITEPTEPAPTQSTHQLHTPAFGDMMLHAMLNEAPLDSRVPKLRVVAWAPILDVTFSSYRSKFLHISSYMAPFNSKVKNDLYSFTYKLIRADHTAEKFVELLAKAKITTKTQPFHLFKLGMKDITFYSTVHESRGYQDEINRTPIAIFLNHGIDEKKLASLNLLGAVCIEYSSNSTEISVNVVSLLNYSSQSSVSKAEVREYVINEASYLYTLVLSSQNQFAIKGIICSNQMTAARLVDWASKSVIQKKTNPNERLLFERSPAGKNSDPTTRTTSETYGDIQGKQKSQTDISVIKRSSNLKKKRSNFASSPGITKNSNSSSPLLNSQNTSLQTPSEAPSKSQKPNDNTVHPISEHSSPVNVTQIAELPTSTSRNSWESVEDSATEEAAEQRNVDAWYNSSKHKDSASLDTDFTSESDDDEREAVRAPELIQLDTYLSRDASNLYNEKAGIAYPPLNTKHVVEQDGKCSSTTLKSSSNLTIIPANDNYVDEFSYLAKYVEADSGSQAGRGTVMPTFPSLREESFVHLGALPLGPSANSAKDIIGLIRPPARVPSNFELDTVEATASHNLTETAEATPTIESLELALVDQQNNETESQESNDEDVLGPVSEYLRLNRLSIANAVTHPVDTSYKSTDNEYSTLTSDINRTEIHHLPTGRTSASRSTSLSESSEEEPGVKPNLGGYEISRSKSMLSFRQVIMSASINTLQLASFVVRIDQMIENADQKSKQDLISIKSRMIDIFQESQKYCQQYKKGQDLTQLVVWESKTRRSLIGMTWVSLHLGLNDLVQIILEVEAVRRARLIDSLQSAAPSSIWKPEE